MVALEDLDHLLSVVRATALLPKEQRIASILADRWIGYTRATEALSKLNDLLMHPKRQRMPNLLIIGPTNNGKSMLVEKFCREHPPGSRSASDSAHIPVLSVQMPSGPDIKRLYGMLLHQMCASSIAHHSLARLETHALDMLETLGIRVLIIDEVHNILSGPAGRQREFLHLLRFLGGCPRIMTADCEDLGQVGPFCSKLATDCVEAARERLSEGLNLAKTSFHASHNPSLSA